MNLIRVALFYNTGLNARIRQTRMGDTERLATLRRTLVEHFVLDEVKLLCFDLGLRYDDLSGDTVSTKAANLLDLLYRTRRIPDLIAWGRKNRPDIAWDDLIDAATGDPNAQSPFKGLTFYDVDDVGLFFGREQLTAQLIARISPSFFLAEGRGEGRFLAIIGASGSGKSSLARAGVVATLQGKAQLAEGDLPEGCRSWSYHITTPTDNPLKALAVSLIPDLGKAVEANQLAAGFLSSNQLLDTVARQLTRGNSGPRRRLFLLVDQFEELFTACKDKAQRNAFIDNLLYASSGAHDGPTMVVLTLRADFYAYCFEHDSLREALSQRQSTIGAMTTEELRRTITEPTRQSNYAFEPGLVALLLRDVGDEPGGLPLLSHALLETWKRRDGRRLTLAGYQASGGVHGAIAKTADSVLDRLTLEQQAIARRIFVGLTELSEGAQDTRRRVTLAELTSVHAEAEAVAAVLQTLAYARLVIIDQDVVEVAHEALIREWPKLRKWLEEDREGERLRRQVADDAREWVRLNRDEGALYRGARLVEAQQWAERHDDEITELERTFLDAAIGQAEREREDALSTTRRLAASEAEARRAEEQATANARLRRQQLGLAAALAAVAFLAAVAAFFGNQALDQSRIAAQERDRAQTQEKIARVRGWAARAKTLQESDPLTGWALAIEALNALPNDESVREQLISGPDAVLKQARLLKFEGNVQDFGAFTGTHSFIVSYNGKFDELRALDGSYPPIMLGNLSDSPYSQNWTLSENGQLLVLSYGGFTEVRKTNNGQIIMSASKPASGSISPDSRWLLLDYSDIGEPGELHALDKSKIVTLTDELNYGGFSKDGQYVVLSYKDKPSEIRSLNGCCVVTLPGKLLSFDFSPDGRIVLLNYDNQPGELRTLDSSRIITLTGRAFSSRFSDDSKFIGLDYLPSGSNELYSELRALDGSHIITVTGETSMSFTGRKDWEFFNDGLSVLLKYPDKPGEIRSLDSRHITVLTDILVSWEFFNSGRSVLLNYSNKPSELRSLDGSIILTLPDRLLSWGFFNNDKSALFEYENQPAELRTLNLDSSRIITLPGELEYWWFSKDKRFAVLRYKGKPGELRKLDNTLVVTLTSHIAVSGFSTDNRKLVLVYSDKPGEIRDLDSSQIITLTDVVAHSLFGGDRSALFDESILLNYRSKPDELRALNGSKTITLLDKINNVALEEGTGAYAVVRYESGQTEILRVDGRPTQLINLGFGVAFQPKSDIDNREGYSKVWFVDKGRVLLVRYTDGRAYMLDLDWLNAINGDPASVSSQRLVELACQGPFKSKLFNTAALIPYLDGTKPSACR